MPIMTDVVHANENKPVNAMKNAKLFQPGGSMSDTKPTVV
jgi:hypothetical protein